MTDRIPKKTQSTQVKDVVPLPLVREEDSILNTKDTTKVGTFKLLTNPTDTASPKYSFAMPYIDGTEGLRPVIQWVLNTRKVLAGLNITLGPPQVTLVNELCKGSANTAFNECLELARLVL